MRVPLRPTSSIAAPRTALSSWRTSPLAVKITRYAVGSLVALGTSVVVFAVLYVLGAGTTACSIAAFFAGAIPNWILNRRWAWEMSGKVEVAREVVGYALVSMLAVLASSLATGWTSQQVKSIPAHHGIRVALVTAAYVLVQAVLFLAKFIVYDRWVFAGRSRFRATLRSWHRVWSRRGNREPLPRRVG
jgi:putative flippase GtrA